MSFVNNDENQQRGSPNSEPQSRLRVPPMLHAKADSRGRRQSETREARGPQPVRAGARKHLRWALRKDPHATRERDRVKRETREARSRRLPPRDQTGRATENGWLDPRRRAAAGGGRGRL